MLIFLVILCLLMRHRQVNRWAESTMTCIMGREAAYSGVKVTWDMMMNSKLDILPKTFDYKDRVPVAPLPVPGVYKFV